MSKKTIFYSILLFIIFLVATIPARTALNWLPESLPISMTGVSNSLWSGDAASVQIERQSVSSVSWTINPLWLFTGKLGGSLSVDDPELIVKGGWRIGFDRTFYFSDLTMKVPAERISQFIPTKGLTLDGDLRLDIRDGYFHPEQGPQEIDATAYWLKGAATLSGQSVKLGNFTLEALSNDKGQIDIQFKPTKNVLDVKGKAVVNWPSDVDIDLTVTENVPASIQKPLQFFKKVDGNRREIKMKLPLNRRR